MGHFDVVIVGAGPAGVSAGIHALELGLDFLVLEKDNAMHTIRDIYPKEKPITKHPPDYKPPDNLWFEACEKQEFLDRWEKIVKRLGENLHLNETVTDIKKEGNVFLVKTNKAEYRSRFVVLAVGVQGRPRKLGVPGEELDNVHYRLKDPHNYSGMNCLVVGGGDTAGETAILLAKSGAKVYISYRRDKFFRMEEENLSEIESLVSDGKIELVFKSNVKRIGHKTAWLDVDGEERKIDIDHVFICIGSIPNKEWLAQLGLELDQAYRPKVNENLETNIPGMFAVGDLTQTMLIPYAIESGWKVIDEIRRRLNETREETSS